MSEEEVLFSDEKPQDNKNTEEILAVVPKDTPIQFREESEFAKKDIKSPEIRFSMKLKILLSLAVLMTASFLFISVFMLGHENRELLQEMEYRARIISQNLAANLSEVFEDAMNRHPLVAGTKEKIEDLLSIRIYNSSFGLEDSSDRDEYMAITGKKANDEALSQASADDQNLLRGLTGTKSLSNPGNELLSIYQPILSMGKPAGFAVLTFTKKLILARIKSIQTTMTLYIILAVVLSLGAMYLLISILLAPISLLVQGVRRLGQGDMNAAINLKTSDELAMLGGEFNIMTQKLFRAQKQIVEKERLEEQIQIAEGLQKNLLPEAYPVSDKFDFGAYYQPARGVGGDYFDVLEFKERNTVGTIIADVSGKGIPAALIMVIIRTVFHAVARFVDSPDKALDLINKNLSGRTSGDKYATMFYYMYDYSTGLLTFSNGGHNPLLVYHHKLKQVKEYDTEGAPVGVMEESVYVKASLQLEEGDIVVINTDGITEASNKDGVFFDEKDLNRAIIKYSALSGNEIKERIIGDITAFVGSAPQHDDMTFIVLKVRKIEKTLKKQEPSADEEKPAGLKDKLNSLYRHPTDLYNSLV